jgi:NADPH-dependent curcumin reductase
MIAANRQVRLKSRPAGTPQAEHLEIVETQVPELAGGELLVRHPYLAIEPAMDGWAGLVAHHAEPVAIEASLAHAQGQP